MNLSSDFLLRVKGAKDGFVLPEDKENIDDAMAELALRIQGKSLTFLDISRCRALTQPFVGRTLAQLCTNLQFLDISYTNCKDLSVLCQSLTGLRALNIAGLQLFTPSLQDLAYLDSLEVLSIRRSNVRDVCSLAQLQCLRSLDLGETTLESYVGILRGKRRLEELFLDECVLLGGDSALQDLHESLSELPLLKLVNLQQGSLEHWTDRFLCSLQRPLASEHLPRRVLFFEAVMANNVAETHWFLSSGIDVHARALLDDLPFFFSVWQTRCCFPKAGLQTPFFVFEDVEDIGLFLPNALHLAIFFHARDVLNLLLYHGADRHARVFIADILPNLPGALCEDRQAFQKFAAAESDSLSPDNKTSKRQRKEKRKQQLQQQQGLLGENASSTGNQMTTHSTTDGGDWMVANQRRPLHARDLVQFCYERNVHRFTEGMLTQKVTNWKPRCDELRQRLDSLLRLGGNIHVKFARRKANPHRRRQRQLLRQQQKRQMRRLLRDQQRNRKAKRRLQLQQQNGSTDGSDVRADDVQNEDEEEEEDLEQETENEIDEEEDEEENEGYFDLHYDTGAEVNLENILEHSEPRPMHTTRDLPPLLPPSAAHHTTNPSVYGNTSKKKGSEDIFETVAHRKKKAALVAKRLQEEDELLSELLGAITGTTTSTTATSTAVDASAGQSEVVVQSKNAVGGGDGGDNEGGDGRQQRKQRLQALRRSIAASEDPDLSLQPSPPSVSQPPLKQPQQHLSTEPQKQLERHASPEGTRTKKKTTMTNNESAAKTTTAAADKEVLPKLPLAMFRWKDHAMVKKLCGPARRYVADLVFSPSIDQSNNHEGDGDDDGVDENDGDGMNKNKKQKRKKKKTTATTTTSMGSSSDSEESDRETDIDSKRTSELLAQRQQVYTSLPSSAQTLPDTNGGTNGSTNENSNQRSATPATEDANQGIWAGGFSAPAGVVGLRSCASAPTSLFLPRRTSQKSMRFSLSTDDSYPGVEASTSAAAMMSTSPTQSSPPPPLRRRQSAAFLQPLVVAAEADAALQAALDEQLQLQQQHQEQQQQEAKWKASDGGVGGSSSMVGSGGEGGGAGNAMLSAKFLAQIEQLQQQSTTTAQHKVRKTQAQREAEMRIEAERIAARRAAHWSRELRVLGECRYLFRESARVALEDKIRRRQLDDARVADDRRARFRLLDERAALRKAQPGVRLPALAHIADVTGSTSSSSSSSTGIGTGIGTGTSSVAAGAVPAITNIATTATTATTVVDKPTSKHPPPHLNKPQPQLQQQQPPPRPVEEPANQQLSAEVAERLELLEWQMLRGVVRREERCSQRLPPLDRRAAFVKATEERALLKFEQRQASRR
jgi:hypothetical protein